MPKNALRKPYDSWIQKRSENFRFRPWISKVIKDSFMLSFQGLAPELTCRLYKYEKYIEAEFYVYDRSGQYWDIVSFFDVEVYRSEKREYFCLACEKQGYFSSLDKLLSDHIFEPILSTVNELTADSIICLWGDPEVESWGAILTTVGANLRQKNIIECFPVILTEKSY